MTAKKVSLTRPVRTVAPITRKSSDEGFSGGKESSPSRVRVQADTPAAARRTLPLGEGVRHREDGGSNAVESVVEQFKALKPAERKQALALMSLETQKTKTGQERDVDMWATACHEALEAALGQSDGAGHGPQVVRRVVGAPSCWGPVDDFMHSSRLADLAVQERLVAYRMLAKMVVSRAKRMARYADIPLTPKLVGTCSQGVAGLFDNAFPGYTAAGLARMVVAQATKASS